MKLEWESIESSRSNNIYKAKVFGGWLVMSVDDVRSPVNIGYDQPDYQYGYEWRNSLTFVPDINGEWK